MSIIFTELSKKIIRRIDSLKEMSVKASYPRKEKIAKTSLRVRKESMKINTEFSKFENNPD